MEDITKVIYDVKGVSEIKVERVSGKVTVYLTVDGTQLAWRLVKTFPYHVYDIQIPTFETALVKIYRALKTWWI
ncbi:hypothetical protein CCACVL1_23544 [Corchorus capsularis]|uniref:Uncharacterized protein n=1 Tax=Corchorus capsularis TaxID=210143 RepID=A0A1R3GTG0_COCAP|nr:hypothetical protein CCACVL1_23544 [Corchorus capsularis]